MRPKPNTAQVVDVRTDAYDVLIARPSKWGNPYIIGVHGDRDDVIALYRRWLWANKGLLAQIAELEGQRLGCYCGPEPCHGDVLINALAWHNANS
jgi:hypothetical protein